MTKMILRSKMERTGQAAATRTDLRANTDVKIFLISKTTYEIEGVGCNLSWMFMGNFLMISYTDIFGISTGAVAGLILFSCFWDAINDPIIGNLTDRIHFRWGRYRPWLLVAVPLTTIVLILIFQAHPGWNSTAKIMYMGITYCILVLGYTCVNIPYGILCGAVTQSIEERTQISTFRSVVAMITIGIINIITMPLIETLGAGSDKRGYLLIVVIYGSILALCYMFRFAKTREVMAIPERKKISLKEQLRAVPRNHPYILVLAGQMLFGLTLYGRNADVLYYFTYVKGSKAFFTVYSMRIIIPSIIGTARFPILFHWTNNKGRAVSIFVFLTGISMMGSGMLTAKEFPILFYRVSALTQFFFSGLSTAIYAIIPDYIEYGGWKTGLRNDRFQYAFTSLGDKMSMVLGTSLLVMVLGMCGYVAGGQQNSAVLAVIKRSFTAMPGMFWIITGTVFFSYRLNRRCYSKIMKEVRIGGAWLLWKVRRNATLLPSANF